MKRKKSTGKTSKPFTTGQLNRLVDDLIHPFCQENRNLIWIDGILHTLIEMNPKVSVEKFVKYNVPRLLKTKGKKNRKKTKNDAV